MSGKEKPFVVGRKCDKPMAEKLHLLPCNKRCQECVACIEWSRTGQSWHVPFSLEKFSDPKLLMRNISILSGGGGKNGR